ncbi:MAG: AsnC family transcriptional regulator [Candidatus Omnitrophota bacterium]
MDKTDGKLIIALQEGMPIISRPYKEMADRLGISEDEAITRVKKLKEAGLIKRIDFRLDLKRMGLATTLVACKIPEREIQRAKEIILNCGNVTHNYLRDHDLNMWFTLSAASTDRLRDLLVGLKERLKADRMLSLQTKNVFKLGFRLKVKNGWKGVV